VLEKGKGSSFEPAHATSGMGRPSEAANVFINATQNSKSIAFQDAPPRDGGGHCCFQAPRASFLCHRLYVYVTPPRQPRGHIATNYYERSYSSKVFSWFSPARQQQNKNQGCLKEKEPV